MEWPRPQPGHQVNPSILSGQNEKCASLVGLVNASEISAATQKASSKYLEKTVLINFIRFCGKQYRYPQCKQYTHQQCTEYPARKIH